MTTASDTSLGRYRLVKVLGKGAMGVVYEAVDPALDRTVAIKTIRKDASDDASRDYAQRFLREAHAAARMVHPNIVATYDFGEQDDLSYIVMEFVRGRELKEILDAGERPSLDESVRIVSQLLQALDYAHQRNIVHRDVKPSNVMLTDSRQVKLTDFGVARITDAQQERTMAGTVIGTPNYMAPEQLTGEVVGARADIFSTGVILYQLLTGTRPFGGSDSASALMYKIVHEDPIPPSRVNPKVLPAFDPIIARALAKKPMDRYASAAEFAADLQNAAAGAPAAEHAPSWPSAVAAKGAGGHGVDGRAPSPAPGAAPFAGFWARLAVALWPPRRPRRSPAPVDAEEPSSMTGDRTVIAPPGQRSAQGLAAERVHTSGDQTVLIGPPVPTASTPVLAISLLVVRSEVASMVGQRFPVTGPATRIGRSDAEIVLPDALLSRQHAIVERKPDGVTIHDLGSANGTQVNGFRLEANRPYPLVPGAHVRVGSTVLAVALDADDSLARLADTELDGRYLLLECLHASPKGAMYRAQKKGSHLPVALKLLAPGYSGWSGYRETFASEAEIAAGLQHPHICRLDDHGEATLMLRDRPVRVPFLAYELMAGGSLSERLPTLAELSTATLLGWIRDLASALDHVHRKGLVHGGLKPSAICFDADGNVYLTDFALGKPRSAEGMTIFGAPAYMAPETWQGAGPSAAGDQYALGVVSYLLLTAVLPYEGQEDPKTRERNLHRPPFALHTLAARNCGRRVSPALTSVVNRALAKNAEQRHESVSAFAARLAGAATSAARSGDSHPVFISYERGDSSAWVTLISQALARDHGVRSFVDTSALDRAEKFPPRIRDAIRDCDVFVCVIGPTTLRSEWVRKEIALACRFRKKMVPVLLERFSESADDLKVRSIKDLLHFGGERVLDQQNLYIPEAMQRIARRVMSGLGGNGNDGDEDGAAAR